MTGGRHRVLGELVAAGPLVRGTRWQPVLAGWAATGGVLAWKADEATDATTRATLLRIVAVILVASVVNLVDDDAADLLAPVPTSLAWRSGVRLTLAGAAVAVPWGGALLTVPPAPLTAALSLECAAMTCVGLALARSAARWTSAREAGLAAGPAVLGAAVATALLPSQWALFTPPGAGWGQAHLRWAMVLGVAVAVLAWTMRDPGHRGTAIFHKPCRTCAIRPGRSSSRSG